MFVKSIESLVMAHIPKMNRCGTPKNNVYGIDLSKIKLRSSKRTY